MMSEPEFWVAVSMVIFLGIVIYMGVPGKLAATLDARTERIGKELAEAQRLREEAQALLAEYERKREEAEKIAEDIIAQARTEAEAYAAELQALKEVRAAASDLAIAAAARIIAAEVTGDKAAKLVDAAIGAVRSRLN